VERGAAGIRALARRHGWGALREASRELLDYAERRTKAVLRTMAVQAVATDYLEGDGVIDDDLQIQVRVTIDDGMFQADFTGTRDAAPGNVNCPIAVTRSAVLFVVRTLLPDDVPMNGGVSRTLDIRAPAGCLVNARPPSAVAAGNVETSQRIADVVFRALAAAGCIVPAQGQGTMNNVTFGGTRAAGSGNRDTWTYYETIGGGQGASRGAHGPSGVHVGMSNTRNTPIEVLEMEHPLRVRTYALRPSSGGAGEWNGGNGVIREFEALVPMETTVLTERRRYGPAGTAGGSDGQAGANLLNGTRLPSKTTLRLAPGDLLRIETPGGGGWGKAQET
jgi:N-methylhydantoinase B